MMLTAMVVVAMLAADGEPNAVVVTRDGGDVPTIAPGLTDNLAPVLAPELIADAGVVVADTSLSVYKIDLPVEITVTAGSLALYAIADFLIKPTLEGDLSCRQPTGIGRCDPSDLTVVDRWAVGRSSKEWTMASDVGLVASLIAPAVYLGLESLVLPTQHAFRDFAGDLLVITEAMALTTAFATVMKFAFRRPRPARYTAVDAPFATFDQELSFPSGHVSMVASATTALTMTVFYRHPKSPMRWVVLASSVALTLVTAAGRVEGGHHFPTDVLMASMIGAFSGFAVPYVHRKELPFTPTAAVNPATGSAVFGVNGRF